MRIDGQSEILNDENKYINNNIDFKYILFIEKKKVIVLL